MIQNSRTFNWNPIGTYCIMSTAKANGIVL
jgi:hypothetical protein